jgi:hypothetical protein
MCSSTTRQRELQRLCLHGADPGREAHLPINHISQSPAVPWLIPLQVLTPLLLVNLLHTKSPAMASAQALAMTSQLTGSMSRLHTSNVTSPMLRRDRRVAFTPAHGSMTLAQTTMLCKARRRAGRRRNVPRHHAIVSHVLLRQRLLRMCLR